MSTYSRKNCFSFQLPVVFIRPHLRCDVSYASVHADFCQYINVVVDRMQIFDSRSALVTALPFSFAGPLASCADHVHMVRCMAEEARTCRRGCLRHISLIAEKCRHFQCWGSKRREVEDGGHSVDRIALFYLAESTSCPAIYKLVNVF